MDGLAVGVTIAALKVLRPEAWQNLCRYANVFFVTGLCILTAALLLAVDEYSWRAAVFAYPLLASGFGCLVIAAVSSHGAFSKVAVPGAKLGATLAFAFYLTHKQMIHITSHLLNRAGVAPQSILSPLVIFWACPRDS